MATTRIAVWVSHLAPNFVPPSTQEAALRSLYNYLGCAIHGSQHSTVDHAIAALSAFFADQSCDILGSSQQDRSDAQHAALINGIASHVHDYDDTHLSTIIHPTGPIASALLAYIQHISAISDQRVNGNDLLTALVAGIEVECKLGLSVWPRHYDTGWHITSTTGGIGAAIAVAKLMKLSQPEIENAIGIAATQVTGLRSNFGSDTKSFHVGRAAQNGLLAALLASTGFTAAQSSLEAKRGWANVVIGGHADEVQLERYVGELGQVWEVEKNSFKPFPCGIVAHPSIDAAIQLREQIEAKTGAGSDSVRAEIERLQFHAKVHHLVVELTSNPNPRNGLEAKFSVVHGIAVGLLYGKAGPVEYEDDIVNDPMVTKIRDAVTAEADPGIASDATVLVAVNKQRNNSDVQKTWPEVDVVYKVHVEHAVGSLHVPMTDEQLTQKFIDQVSIHKDKGYATRISDLCWSIVKTDDVNGILKQLAVT